MNTNKLSEKIINALTAAYNHTAQVDSLVLDLTPGKPQQCYTALMQLDIDGIVSISYTGGVPYIVRLREQNNI